MIPYRRDGEEIFYFDSGSVSGGYDTVCSVHHPLSDGGICRTAVTLRFRNMQKYIMHGRHRPCRTQKLLGLRFAVKLFFPTCAPCDWAHILLVDACFRCEWLRYEARYVNFGLSFMLMFFGGIEAVPAIR